MPGARPGHGRVFWLGRRGPCAGRRSAI